MATPPAPPPPVRESAPPPPERREPPAPVAQRPAPEPAAPVGPVRTAKLIEDYLNRLLDAYFDYNKAELRTDARTALNSDSSELRSLLKEFPTAKFVVEGNCDERGSPEYNLALGDRRAKAAYEFLTQIGVRRSGCRPSATGRSVRSAPITTKIAGRKTVAPICPPLTNGGHGAGFELTGVDFGGASITPESTVSPVREMV